MSRPPLFVLLAALTAAAEPFPWQLDHAARSETGDLEWAPRPFRFEAAGEVRYIDYEQGDDTAAGTRAAPWKHHPWDPSARGVAAAAGEVDTFVFKGGSIYRGQLVIGGEGSPGRPLRLTRDPEWGEGPAVLAGSMKVTGFTRGSHPDIPDSGVVWKAELPVSPRSLWIVGEDGIGRRIPLARHPNWTSQPEDHKAEWFTWTNDRHPFNPPEGWTANDSEHLRGLETDFVEGALIYSEFGWVMGTPYPTRVRKHDPSNGAVDFAGWTGGGSARVIHRGMRYYLEDKPQYLDDPEGEFWFEREGKGPGGTLYLRAPGGVDPNRSHFEAGFRQVLIGGDRARHLEITGLDFRWTAMSWNLDTPAWDYRTKPFGIRPTATPAAIRVRGTSEGLRIAHCRFEHLAAGINLRPVEPGQTVTGVRIEDNAFAGLDILAVDLSDGTGWGFANPFGRLDDIHLLRNHARDIGFRPTRSERGCTFNFTGAERLHAAGNVVERCGAQAINVYGGKTSGVRGEVPLIRILIHQNKAWKTMQNANDFGGIEAWQHGPVYIFDNLSHDPRGQWEGRRNFSREGSPGFGHAYYLDGGFKNYLFNNIAWGKSNDPASPLVNCSAFQEIHSYQNVFFNNTAYNFHKGSRRQAPEAGRDKFLGNVWQDIGRWVFWHHKPAGEPREANADHAARDERAIDFGTNAYARNVFHAVPQGSFAAYTPDGGWIADPEAFAKLLGETGAIAAGVGETDPAPVLADPAAGDFRPRPGSRAIDRGARVFVPWSLKAVVAEWNFYPAGDDPTRIIDEHWFARDYLTDRERYESQPMYPLTAVNVELGDYVEGPLENWTAGALRLDPRRRTYARLDDERLDRAVTRRINTRARHGQDPQAREITFSGSELRNAEIFTDNLLIEVVLQARGDGLIVGKRGDAGYRLGIEDGKARLELVDDSGRSAVLSTQDPVADGEWRHLIAEVDREAREMRIYLDGERVATGPGPGPTSLENEADLFVGGTDEGEHLDATLEFLRISLGTLADAHTSIEELHAWQFDGPAGRDFTGRRPEDGKRDAGALEAR